ncbi:Tubulin-specific chaperone E [Hypsizygus marmoreus]|uniref:U2 small nuclear ribonucleoprotein A' n=1 Tax=Hypsizygus marmoreus TaxID=39966 RepID=A0A369JRJ6_HYPMA|nr:Tubulin-specific chaperone E [Hypsizygus marmoreus]
MHLPSEGARINLAGHFGTVRFVGKVDNTTGIWLGVEWDDPRRGRHDGTKDGKRYFTCRIRNSGSFVRPSAHISYGRSFLEALTAKYIEPFHGSESQETVVLGSSHGAVMVEAVRLDKIRGKLANLEKLHEVSLDNENLARCDPPGAIRATCPEIRGLDLSMSLLPSWDVVALIAIELPVLQRLALNRNRLQPATNRNVMEAAFLHLTELRLNGTTTTWAEMKSIVAVMPRLRLVEMGYNGLTHLQSQDDEPLENNNVQVINLDSNMCSDWVHLVKSLLHITSLQRLILTSNCVGIIPFPERRQQGLPSLKHISLSHNKINSWSDVDALSSWCPGLETLTLSGNPLTEREKTGHSRPFTISKIPSLLTLDGAAISLKERADSEIFYQSYIVQHGPGSEDERVQAHPQWLSLCAKHGKPNERTKDKASQDKLSQHLIGLNLHQTFDSPHGQTEQSSESLVLRVLPTMTLRALRLKACKALKRFKATVIIWLRRADGTLVELGTDCDQQSLDRLGLEDGSNLVIRVTM